MKQKAIVTKVYDNSTAEVSVLRVSACSACSARHVCGSAKKAQSTVNNKLGAKVGDTVEIEVPSQNVIGYSSLVFLAPVLLAIALYLPLAVFGEIYGILGAAAGFTIPLVIAFFISKANAEKVRPTVTAILTGEEAEPNGENGCGMQR